MSTDLQTRFEQALRAALDGPQHGGSSVVVRAPDVNVAPRVVAEMPALPQPLEVLDVARHGAAFEYEIRPVRDAQGLLISARLVPVALVSFGGMP
jgi:hypothetical protein